MRDMIEDWTLPLSTYIVQHIAGAVETHFPHTGLTQDGRYSLIGIPKDPPQEKSFLFFWTRHHQEYDLICEIVDDAEVWIPSLVAPAHRARVEEIVQQFKIDTGRLIRMRKTSDFVQFEA